MTAVPKQTRGDCLASPSGVCAGRRSRPPSVGRVSQSVQVSSWRPVSSSADLVPDSTTAQYSLKTLARSN